MAKSVEKNHVGTFDKSDMTCLKGRGNCLKSGKNCLKSGEKCL